MVVVSVAAEEPTVVGDTAAPWQDIIPGLPDDVSLRCLARISHGFHGVLQTVCKRWREVFRSEEFGAFQSSMGWSGDWIFVLTESPSNSTHPPNWIGYDPANDSWHPLPPAPTPPQFFHLHHRGFSSVSVSSRLLVIGGAYSPPSPPPASPHVTTDLVFQFDPCRNSWTRLASMLSPRSHFACAVLDGKVFVAGGRNSLSPWGISSAEVYDPLTDRWEELPVMRDPQSDCVGLSFNGKFCVLSDQVGLSEMNVSQVFDPSDRTWCIQEQAWPFSRAMQFGIQVMPDERVYAIADWGSSVIKTRLHDDEQWLSVGVVPPVVIPGHRRPLEAFSYGFTALRGKLYVLGGKVLRWQEAGTGWFDIVKLNCVRVCDPDVKPLQWKARRPMCCDVGGCIIGCTSLEEGRT